LLRYSETRSNVVHSPSSNIELLLREFQLTLQLWVRIGVQPILASHSERSAERTDCSITLIYLFEESLRAGVLNLSPS